MPSKFWYVKFANCMQTLKKRIIFHKAIIHNKFKKKINLNNERQ